MNNKLISMIIIIITLPHLQAMESSNENYQIDDFVIIDADLTETCTLPNGMTSIIQTNGTKVIKDDSGWTFTMHPVAQQTENISAFASQFIKKHDTYLEVITDPDNNIREISYPNGDHFFDQENNRQFLRKDGKDILEYKMKKDQPGVYFKNTSDVNPNKLCQNVDSIQLKAQYLSIPDIRTSFINTCYLCKNN